MGIDAGSLRSYLSHSVLRNPMLTPVVESRAQNRKSPAGQRLVALTCSALLVAIALAPALAFADRGPRLIVKYHSRGADALTECAERISRGDTPFSEHVRRGGEELDALHARMGISHHKAIFRKPDGRAFAIQRNELAARLSAAQTARRSARARHAHGAGVPELPDLAHIYRVELQDGADPEAAAEALRADPHVDYAQVDYALALDQHALAFPFNDPYLTSEGAWGQAFADLWGLERIRAPEAWEQTLGEGIVVAVVDTGLDRFHPDIAANVWVNQGEDLDGDGLATAFDQNGIDDDGNGFIDDLTGFDFAESFDADEDGRFDGPNDLSDPDPFDVFGHGTHVAGTIAAVANNGEGIVGVAPGAKIMALRGFDDEGQGADSVLWRAVLYAVENGATVVNNSWSCGDPCPRNPLAEDVLEIAEAFGTVVVTSAGNASTDVAFRSPENTGRVLTVGALGYDDRLAFFSNRGWGLDLVAPGGGPQSGAGGPVVHRNILSLLTSAPLEAEAPFVVGERYRRLAGTSMASPHVAGAIALLASRRPELSPAALRALVRRSARDLGHPGHDPFYGAGALDLVAMLELEPPDADFQISGPDSGDLIDPRGGPLHIEFSAFGADVTSVDISVAPGLVGRVFTPVDDLAGAAVARSADGDREFLTLEWPLEDVPNGPFVMRFRVELSGGPPLEEYRVIAVERIVPLELGGAGRGVGLPAVDGRTVVWAMDAEPEEAAEGEAATGPGRVLAAARIDAKAARAPEAHEPGSAEFPVLARPSTLDIDRQLVAWRVIEDDEFQIRWCRLPRDKTFRPPANSLPGCDEQNIDRAPGAVTRPFAAGGWIVWQRDNGLARSIEGCYVGRKNGVCTPRSIVDQSAGVRWTLRSFDGDHLLIDSFGAIARCRPPAKAASCEIQEIRLGLFTPNPIEPVLVGDILVFNDVTFGVSPPLGCLPSESTPECRPVASLLQRYYACQLKGEDPLCDSIPITQQAPAESFAGLAVEGRRISWSVPSSQEASSIRYCEFDARQGLCPEQRLTGSALEQEGPALSEGYVVWRGAREAGPAIWAYGLPSLNGPEQAAMSPGIDFELDLVAKRGSARSLTYAVVPVGATSAEALSELRILDPGAPGGKIQLVGRVDVEGPVQLEVRAKNEAGLESRWLVELHSAQAVER